jgi:hypothetical protein
MDPNFAKTERHLRPDNKLGSHLWEPKVPHFTLVNVKKYHTLKKVYIGCVMCKIFIKW